MASTQGELWHIVEAKRDDGMPTLFRIRELEPQTQLDKIFVVEMPYPANQLSGLPDVAAYQRSAEFDERWLRPACEALGWQLVGTKTEDGSFFHYMYGAGSPEDLIARLSPFDANLGFYDDTDPEWLEYGALRELLDLAKALEPAAPASTAPSNGKAKAKSKPKSKSKSNPEAKVTTTKVKTPNVTGKARPLATTNAKAAAKTKAKAKTNARSSRSKTKSDSSRRR